MSHRLRHKIRALSIMVTAMILFHCGTCLNVHAAFSRAVIDLVKEAERLYSDGDYAQAQAKCQKALELDADFFVAYNILGRIAAKEPELIKEAISYFSKSIALYPDQLEAYIYISSFYIKLGEIDQAISYLEEGLVYNPSNFQMNFNAGLLYLVFRQDPHHAIGYLEKALVAKPDYPRLVFLTGAARLFAGEPERVLESITNLRRLKNEYLARRLEKSLHRAETGEQINMKEVINEYSKQPKSSQMKASMRLQQPNQSSKPPSPEPSAVIVGGEKAGAQEEDKDQPPMNVTVTAPNTQSVSARGTVQITRHYRRVGTPQ